MAAPVVRITACECVTALGATEDSLQGLLHQQVGLRPQSVLGHDGGDAVPLALVPGRTLDETAPPNWLPSVRALLRALPIDGWGSPRRPVLVTSSNFGVGSLYAYRRTGDTAHLAYGTPFACVDWLADELGWGPNVTTFSHACVTAHLGLLHGSRLLEAGLADEVLIFSFDYLSPFVVGGFHALKILNGAFPAPYQDRPTGAIGLGDGAAFAVLSRDRGEFRIAAQNLHNEMHHFTANRADGAGFEACIQEITTAAAGRRIWLKGHGTGTLEAGRLEAGTLTRQFPNAPLVGWKGSLGHTLGSCGLVELAIALAAMRTGRAPGTVGSAPPCFSPNVALESFNLDAFDTVLCTSNAFGGAHAALLVDHD